MTRHKNVEARKDQKLKLDWKSEVHLLNDYAKYHDQLLNMLRKFQFMWNGHPDHVNIAKHLIKLTGEKTQPIRSAPYRDGPKTREFEEAEIDKMLLQEVIEPAQTEWATPIAFASKKDGSLHFCVEYKKLNAVTKRDS